MSPIGVVYGNAEVRGRLRVWKKQLAQHYAQFDVGYESLRDGNLKSIPQDLVKCTRGGRERALSAIRRAVGPGATFETTYLNGRLALFSILKPRSSVICETYPDVSEGERASLFQDCVTVNYFLVGKIPGALGDRIELAEGLWTLEVPDHALGRAVERSRYLHPGAIIREAHLNLLELPNAAMRLLNGERRTAYVKAGPGCFVAAISAARDVSNDDQYGVHVRVATWLDEDQLHADQVPLHEKGKPGDRLVDGWLRPEPLRKIVETESGTLNVVSWQPAHATKRERAR